MAVEFTAVNAGAGIVTAGEGDRGKISSKRRGDAGLLRSSRSTAARQEIKKPRRAPLVGPPTILAVRSVRATATLTVTTPKRVIQARPALVAAAAFVVEPTAARRGTAPLERKGRKQQRHLLHETTTAGPSAKWSLIARTRGNRPGRQGRWPQQARPFAAVLPRPHPRPKLVAVVVEACIHHRIWLTITKTMTPTVTAATAAVTTPNSASLRQGIAEAVALLSTFRGVTTLRE